METSVATQQTELKPPQLLAQLYDDNVEVLGRTESLNFILNQPPKPEWIKEHPYITGWKYIPIERVESLLRKIFKKTKVEILREGTAFNGVYVVVRVHYFDPASNEMSYHDGIGAMQLQTKKGTSPADLANINNGAISMAFPIAKSLAVKDATDHLGKLFGSDLNRKDVIIASADMDLINKQQVERYAKALEDENN
jgi:hypothetical protein